LDAIRLLVRADLRRRRAPLLVLMLTTALVVGAVLAATAGARRTSGVLDRFLDATSSSDYMAGIAWPAIADDDALVLETLERLQALDGVEGAAAHSFMPIDAGTEYDFGAVTPYGDRVHADVPIVIEGRLPDDDAPYEVAINEIAADELGLGIGDVLEAGTMTDAFAAAAFETNFDMGFELEGPRLELDVVGVVREVEDLSPTGSENPQAYTSLAFRDEFEDASRFTAMFMLTTDSATFDRLAVDSLVRDVAPPGAEVFGGPVDLQTAATRTAFDSISIGLAIFAAVGMLTGLIVIALVMLRHLQLGGTDRRSATALGMPDRQLVVAAWTPLVIALVPGVALGSLLAYAASPLFPYSVARRAEVTQGLRFDPVVNILVAGGVLVLLVAIAATLSAIGVRRSEARTTRPSGRLAGARSHLAPPIADGCSTVLWAAGRRTTVRPWTAVARAVIGIAGIVAIGAFEASRTEAAGDPARFGQTWDLSPDLLTTDPMGVVEGLAADPRVDGVGGVFCGSIAIDSEITQLCTFYILDGTISPLVTTGRLPSSPGEIALGEVTRRRLGIQVGETVTTTDRTGATVDLAVVGTVVNPDVGDSYSPGDGGVMSMDGLEQLLGSVWDQPYSELVIDLPEEADVAATATALAAEYPIEISPYAFTEPPDQLVQLGRMRTSLLALAVFLGTLGTVGLIHYLVLSARRRRSQIAVLRTLGFVRTQVCGSAAAQAATVAICGLLIGVPVGLITGRWAWLFAVRDIGMDDTPVVPWSIIAAVVGASILGAVTVALYPGLAATRRRPASALRAE
jgi:hypothetical protein